MKILWKYFRRQKWSVGVAILLATVAQLLSLTDPVIFGKIIDNYATNSKSLTQQARWLNCW
ncbi:MAG: hypothetical protein ABIN89_02290 [Chitinophagaceae bacterium]